MPSWYGGIAVIVIYADVLFMINTLVDYCVILITGRLAGIPLRRKRFFAAAILGGGYAAAAAFPNLEILNSIPAKLLIWLFMDLIAFGYTDRFIREMILSGIVSGMMAGVILALGIFFQNSLFIFLPGICHWLLVGGICCCFLCSVLFRSCAKSRVDGTALRASLSIGGNEVVFTALLDTGNQLRDSVTGQPILVVSPCALKSVLPKIWGTLLSSDFLENTADYSERIEADDLRELCPRLIPYQALGVSSGTLLALQTDWIRIQSTCYPRALVAIAPHDLGLGYSALWGGTWKGASIEHDFTEKTSAVAAETTEG